MSRLTVADIDTADPRELAAALRRECEKWMGKPKGLGEAIVLSVVSSIVRAAAVRFVAHDGTLPAPEGE